MWRSPAFFQEILNQQGLVGKLYDAIEKDDLSDAVIIAMDILKKTNNMPPLVKEAKCKLKSNSHRQQGNKAFKSNKFQNALEWYNKALMYAPKGSEELVLGYSNRSALLSKCKMFQACLKDVSTCFELGYPPQISDKLANRRSEATKNVWIERMAMEMRFCEFSEDYLEFRERRNPQITCASIDVGIIKESHVPKVVAVRDVKVGKLIAIEKAFTSQLDRKLLYSACYYCHKMSLNLIPCEGCTKALFCSADCRRTCMEEYHSFECPIIEIFDEISSIPVSKLAVITAIKLRKKFKSWEEFNEATKTVGLKRMKKSEINEIFNSENKFSLLNFKDDAIFTYGMIYNATFGCAIVVHYLNMAKSFFPTRATEKAAAVCGFSRLLMYYAVHLIQTQISSTVSVMAHGKTEFCEVANFGVFPFTGKLKGACNPNVLVVGLNKEVALITIQPLKQGTELTIAYLGHWLDNNIENGSRLRNMFTLYNTVCACAVCNGDWKLLRNRARPTETHLRAFRKLNVSEAIENYCSSDIEHIYPKCCRALAFLHDLPFSNQYIDVYKLFRKCLLDIQDQYSSNIMLDGTND
ncbi:SET and MYND domain-containing protein 4-like [Ostrinia nubilalis]|uniref:SET and MYND domain-containing protein 4-like n=1 Tax=Ostrinia nubilalis TaxID=29057 RepID=UPI003082290A